MPPLAATPHPLPPGESRWPLALRIAALAALYCVVGRLGLLLAIPPGYASAIFPPSGIALAALLVYGTSVWPAIWLGSLALNTWLASGLLTGKGLLIAAGIGTGATLQALLAAYLVRRFVTKPLTLNRERDVLAFLVLGGPAACAVNATVGPLTLLLAGAVPAGGFAANWLTWWIGDTLGVLVVAPLMLTWVAEPRALWQRRRWSVGVPLTVALALSSAFFVVASRGQQESYKLQFERDANHVAAAIRKTFAGYADALAALERYTSLTPQLTQEGYDAFAMPLLARNPGIYRLAWAPRVAAAGIAGFEAEHSTPSIPYRVTNVATADAAPASRAVDASRDVFPILYSVPLARYRDVVGLDVGSTKERAAALAEARDGGEAAAADGIRLAHDPDQQLGILLVHPIYTAGADLSSVAARRAALRGYVAGALRVGDMIDAALRDQPSQGIAFTLAKAAPDGTSLTLYQQGEALAPGASGTPLKGLSFTTPVAFGRRSLQLSFSPTPSYMPTGNSMSTFAFMVCGLLFTALLGAFLLVMTGRGMIVEALIAERTSALSNANRRAEANAAALKELAAGLADRVTASDTELGQRRGELRDQNERLRIVVETSGMGTIYADLRAGQLHPSERFREIFGLAGGGPVTREDLFSRIEPEDRALALSAVSGVGSGEASGGQGAERPGSKATELRVRGPGDEPRWVMLHGQTFFEQTGDGVAPARYIGAALDITERKNAEMALHASREHMALAISVAGMGTLTIERAGGEAYLWSPEARRLYGLGADQPLDLMTVVACVHPEDRDAFIAERKLAIAERRDLYSRHRVANADGSLRWVEFKARGFYNDRQSDPVRTVGVVVDVTERVLAEQSLRSSEEKFRELADAVPNMVWVINEQGVPTFFNRRWLDYTGLGAATFSDRTRAQLVHPHDLDDATRGFAEARATGTDYVIEYRLRAKDGGFRWFLAHTVPIRDGQGQILRWIGTATDIDDQKRAERQAREVEQRLLAVLYNSKVVLWGTDKDRVLTMVEGRAANRWGMDKARLIGTNLDALEDGGDILESARRAMAGESFSAESLMGETWFETHYSPVRSTDGQITGMVGISTDITERKQAELASLTSEAKFRQLSEAIPQLVWIMGEDGTLLYFNQRWFDYTGQSEDEAFGAGRAAVFHEADRAVVLSAWELTVSAGQSFDIECRLRQQDGSYRWFLGRSFPLRNAAGAVMQWAGTFTDIEDQKRRVNLEISERSARASARLKSEFLATMSHEIRTPINGVLGLTSLLLDTPLDAEQRSFAEGVQASGATLLTVINDILDFSKIEAGKLDFENIAFPLRSVLDEALSAVSFVAAQKGLALTCRYDDQDRQHFRGDPGRLKQVLINLLTNAVKFTAKGSVQLSAGQIGSEDGVAVLRFAVEDTGIGMAPATLEKLFQPFTQADNSTTRRYGGTGLGLSISKHLVGRMGGEIDAQSEEGKGSTFWFTARLPLAAQPAPAPPPPPVKSEREVASLKAARVLVVDDVAINQVVAARLLEKAGVRAVSVSSGAAALAELRKAPFDLVLMDCQMPEMDGYEATRQIRLMADAELAGAKDLPIVAMTANAMKGDREKCLRAGMNDYISKPISAEALYAVLQKWLLGVVAGAAAEGAESERAAPPAKPAVDLSYLDQLEDLLSTPTNRADVAAYISRFLALTETALIRMRAALAAGDSAVIGFEAHALKGAGTRLGALAVAQICEALELRALGQSSVAFEALLGELEEACAAASRQLAGERDRRSVA